MGIPFFTSSFNKLRCFNTNQVVAAYTAHANNYIYDHRDADDLMRLLARTPIYNEWPQGATPSSMHTPGFSKDHRNLLVLLHKLGVKY